MVPFVALIVLFAWQGDTTPDTAEAHLGKGYDALKQNRYELAATEFRAALRLDPKLVTRARFPLGVALFEMRQWTDARQEFEAVRRETGDHPNVLYYLGRLDLIDQNFEGAIRNLSAAIEKPPFPDTAYYLGLACFKKGDLSAAEKWLKIATETNPRDSTAAYQLAQVYRGEKHDQEANEMFARSAEIRRRQTEEDKLEVECAKALESKPRNEARAVCQQLYDTNDVEKLTALGTIYGRHGELEAALGPLRRAAELAPQSPQTQYNLAFTYYQLNRFAEARAPIAAAVERWPDIFQLNMLYGAVLLKLGLYSDGLHYFEQAAKLRPDDPEPLRNLAEIYEMTGRPKEALAAQQQAERLMHSSPKLP